MDGQEILKFTPDPQRRVLPEINKTLLIKGITPLTKGTRPVREFNDRALFKLVGFDTESYSNSLFKTYPLSFQISYKSAWKDGGNLHTDVHLFPKRGITNLEKFPNFAYVFAHSLDFDLLNLIGNEDLDRLKQTWTSDDPETVDGWTGHFTFKATNFAHFRMGNGKHSQRELFFIDTMNFKKGRLEKLTRAYLPRRYWKLKRPSWLGKRPFTEEEKHYFIKYAVRDAEAVYALGTQIYQDFLLRGIAAKYTPAGMAAANFRTNFLTENWELPLLKHLRFIWDCYKGARFEAYARGTTYGNVNYYDINSLYPYAMTQPMPFESARRLKGFTLEQFERDSDKIIGWVHVKGSCTGNVLYPQLPQKTYKMFYPLNFDSYGTTYELKNCLNDVNVESVNIIGFYPTEKDKEHPLKAYVLKLYARKQELDRLKAERPLTVAETLERDSIKLELNSTYGKTVERNYDPNTGLWKGGRMFNPAIGSLITGFARATISQYIKKYRALYTDTDCLFTRDKVPTSEKLGEFKKEAEDVARCVIVRPKLYFLFDKEGNLIKKARHSFSVSPKMVMYLMNRYKNYPYVKYSFWKFLKFSESIIQGRGTLEHSRAKKKVSFVADEKRLYDRALPLVKDVLGDWTESQPILNAPQQRTPRSFTPVVSQK